MTVVFPVVIYVLYTAVIPAAPSDVTVGGLTWPVYFLVSMAAYGAIGAAMSQAVPVATERRQGWTRQLRVTPLPGLAYVAAKAVTAIALTVPSIALVSAPARSSTTSGSGSRPASRSSSRSPSAPRRSPALGLLIGYVLDAESAQGGMVLTLFTMAILGGLFAPLESLPPTMATIGWMLPSSHLASLGRAVAAGTAPGLADIAVLAAYTLVIGGLAAWRYVRDERQGRG